MANKNDARILEIKKQIEEKKAALGKIGKFTPTTNCSLELDNVRYNIQVLPQSQLITLLVRVNSCLLSAKDLGVEEKYELSGYKAQDWIADIKLKLEILSKKDEEKNLKAMEEKLSKLLSDEKQVELEIDAIESSLKMS